MNTPLTAHLDPSYRHFNFQSHIQGRYDIRNSVSLALACHLAYRTEAEVTAQAQAWGFPRVKFLEDKVVGVDTQAFVMGNAETVIVAFRGTESSTDWRTDLNFPKVDAMFGKVHKGFRSALEAVIDDVLGAVAEMRDQDQDLWITGHSLGAALATLTTAFYRHQRQTVNGLYTFGSPRVGGNRFDRFFEPDFGRHSFRVVNGNDIVTRVPPRSFGFHHVGTCVFFDGDGDWQVNPGPWQKFLDQLSIIMENITQLTMVDSHLLGGERGYIAALLKEYQRQNPRLFHYIETQALEEHLD